MLWLTTLVLSLRSLIASKLRSSLAVLGIVIGVTAVIALLALGSGARRFLLLKVASLEDMCFVFPGESLRRGVAHGGKPLTISDALRISHLPGARNTAPMIMTNAEVTRLTRSDAVSVIGTTSNYFDLRNYRFVAGRGFTQAEEEAGATVVVLAAKTATKIFGDVDPIGEAVRVGQNRLRVIGVLAAKDDDIFGNTDERVVIGIDLARELFTRSPGLTQLMVQRTGQIDNDELIRQIKRTLRLAHHLEHDDSDDFGIFSAQEQIQQLATVTSAMTSLLGAIGGIALVVGGIGIMNIMLVTVTERTREIGVRKAIGARDRDILRQFLIEAVLLTSIGGALGVGLGAALMWIAGTMMPFAPLIEPSSIVIALGFSASVGIFFGFYPAFRASRLDPIEALHHE